MKCKCEKPEPRERTRACRNCGRWVYQEPLLSFGLMQRELNRQLANHVDVMSRFPRVPIKPLSVRQRIARNIRETRRRLYNAKAALNGAFEADNDE